jgi:glycosyltransferase involved in cell wall biosynthesis
VADKFLSEKANALVVISYYLKERYTALSGGKVPVAVIPTVLDVNKWDAGPEVSNNIPVLLYYGAFFGFDEIEKMIEAISILKSKAISVKLNLIGHNRRKPQYMDAIAEMIQNLGLTKEVELKGFVKHENLKGFLKEANILIGLRKDDKWSSTGLSTKLSEYLSTGRMVICTAIGDNTKYLKDKESAMLMRPGCSSVELAEVLSAAIADNERRIRIGANGRKVALDNFDFSVAKNDINKLLSEIVS